MLKAMVYSLPNKDIELTWQDAKAQCLLDGFNVQDFYDKGDLWTIFYIMAAVLHVLNEEVILSMPVLELDDEVLFMHDVFERLGFQESQLPGHLQMLLQQSRETVVTFDD